MVTTQIKSSENKISASAEAGTDKEVKKDMSGAGWQHAETKMEKEAGSKKKRPRTQTAEEIEERRNEGRVK